jgi:hypothetical protein
MKSTNELLSNPTVCTTVAIYTCIQQLPVKTPAVPQIFFVSFCPSNQISWIGQQLVTKGFIENSF